MYVYFRTDIVIWLIRNRSISASMPLTRRAANPREAVPVRAVLQNLVIPRIWWIFGNLLSLTPSGLARFRTKFETLDTPAMGTTPP